MTLTTRRSSRGCTDEVANGVPQEKQKRAASGFSCAQTGQICTGRGYD